MNDRVDDDRLRRLLSDAVSDIEPENRLDELRASVRPSQKVVPMSRPRSWYAAAGIIATAAVIGVVAFVTSVAGNDPDTLVPTGHGGGTSLPTAIATDTATTSPSPSSTTGTRAYAVYYVGTSPQDKPVLFREFHRGPASTPTARLAVDDLAAPPLDADYSTVWRPGWLKDAKADPNAGVIRVTPSAGAPTRRPAGMRPDAARAAVQQVVYTLQAAFRTRLPVQFVRHGHPVDRVLGVTTASPVAQGSVLSVLSLVNISSPNEGDRVSGRLPVTGVNNGFEGSVVVYLEQHGHRYLIHPTIGGMGGNRLYPWKVTLDLNQVTPGRYTLVAQNDDPSGRGNAAVDTRVITVE